MQRIYCVSFLLLDPVSSYKTTRVRILNDETAHEYKSASTIGHTSALVRLDQECEIKNVGRF